jgi:hypothetical protein
MNAGGKRQKSQEKRQWIEIQDKRMYCLHIKFLRIYMNGRLSRIQSDYSLI